MQVIIEKYIAPVVVGRRVDHITAIMADIEKVVANARFAKAGRRRGVARRLGA